MQPDPKAIIEGLAFFGRLPFYLLRRIHEAQPEPLVRSSIEDRSEALLDRVREDVFARPDGVYAALMRHAGCECGDVDRGVKRDGLEATLTALFRAGVYLTVDEFKGRQPVRRGNSLQIEAGPDRTRSPRAGIHLRGSSGGSRSAGTPVLFDLDFVRACAVNCYVNLLARGGRDWIKADWESPGAGARFRLMKYSAFGRPPQAWFTQMHLDDPLLPGTVRWNTRVMRAAGWVVGRPFPKPVHAPLSQPEPVAAWLAATRRRGLTPVLQTFPSSAVRACLAAAQLGYDIAGSKFIVGGEPVTEFGRATIESTGSEAIPRYGSMEAGAVGYGCLHGCYADDVHLVENMHALIQAGPDGPERGLSSQGLLLTALHCRSPFLMINTSMGDEAVIEDRDCGCPLQQLGWTKHLHDVRSFEKLTTLGVTFLGSDLIPILEQVLPSAFGGAPTDFQLVEGEGSDGQPFLEIRVHPRVGPLDGALVMDTFCSAISKNSSTWAERLRLWRDAGILRVSRQAPKTSKAGKILHIHRLGAGDKSVARGEVALVPTTASVPH
jgi:hypothetical protein